MHLHKLSVRLSSAVFLLLAAAAPAAAAVPAEAPATEATAAGGEAAPAAKPAEPKKICQTIESSTGRIASKRVCMTKEEWRNAKFD